MSEANSITISLGKPVTAPVLIPVEHKATPSCIDNPFMIDGKSYKVTAMSFGNPYGAVFVDDVDNIDARKLGESLGTHALFPEGAGIVFAQTLGGNNIKARLWHREGREFTPEAACVAGTAAIMLRKILSDEVNIFMKDNIFKMEWNRGAGDVTLTGEKTLLNA